MKPVMQTVFGKEGNCYTACLASILEIPIEKVPNFKGNSWLKEAEKWLRVYHNCSLIGFRVENKDDFYCIPAVYHIMSGKSSRGLLHAVVGFQSTMVFDPHPDKSGLVTVEGYEFLYPFNRRLSHS